VRGVLIGRQKLIGNGSPTIVSSARSEITARNFMAGGSIPIVAKNVKAWSLFRTIPGKIMAVPTGFPDLSRRRKAAKRPRRSSPGFTAQVH
jgi:hypothetical protein